ncbi:MAG: bifunctional nuclease family protein [Nocardioides sp.]
MREVDVIGVRVEVPSNQPIVLLREVAGERYLPIWIGSVEATAIAFAQQGVVPPRPLTHDLLRDILTATGDGLREVKITEMVDGIFYATLVLTSGVEVSARPSDSIALALRTGSRILCAEEVLDQAALSVPVEEGEEDDEEEVEKFREFLDHVSAEDFDQDQQ